MIIPEGVAEGDEFDIELGSRTSDDDDDGDDDGDDENRNEQHQDPPDGSSLGDIEATLDDGNDEPEPEPEPEPAPPRAPLVSPFDCVGRWEPWSQCDQQCGPGHTRRVYRITRQAKSDGSECTVLDPTAVDGTRMVAHQQMVQERDCQLQTLASCESRDLEATPPQPPRSQPQPPRRHLTQAHHLSLLLLPPLR